jgi:hypothetical protein
MELVIFKDILILKLRKIITSYMQGFKIFLNFIL